MKNLSTVLGIFALCFALITEAYAETEYSLKVKSGDGVTSDGSNVTVGEIINEQNVDEIGFAEGGFLIVTNTASGINYRVSSIADLTFLGEALASNTNGVAIGRWVVGGGVQSNKRSSMLSLQQNDSDGGASETPGATVKATPTTTTQPVQNVSPASPRSVPRVRPASTPSAPAATPAGP